MMIKLPSREVMDKCLEVLAKEFDIGEKPRRYLLELADVSFGPQRMLEFLCKAFTDSGVKLDSKLARRLTDALVTNEKFAKVVMDIIDITFPK